MIQSSREPSLQLTIHRVGGSVTVAEIANVIQKFYEAGPTLNVLWDFTRADISAIKTGEVEMLVRVVAQHSHSRDGGKNAVLSPHDASFGLSRVYQSLAESAVPNIPTRVFRTEEDARKWLASST